MTTDTDQTLGQADRPGGAADAAADAADWLRRIEEIGEEAGYFEPLGPRHVTMFADEGTTLLVTFETMDAARRDGPGGLPYGLALAREHGWSHLCILAEGETWFRDKAVYRYFDRLVDDAFFEDFDRVLFFGAGMAGYAAAAYSVTAPGATVLLLSPRATLDPMLAGWDARHRSGRRLCFTDRYGFAPDMTEGAGDAIVVFDPAQREDAMHAALFARPWATLIRTRWLGTDLGAALRRMGVLDELIVQAMAGGLTRATLAARLRRRRDYGPYLRRVLLAAQDRNRPGLEAMVCRSVVGRLKAPAFRKRLAELTAAASAGAGAAPR